MELPFWRSPLSRCPHQVSAFEPATSTLIAPVLLKELSGNNNTRSAPTTGSKWGETTPISLAIALVTHLSFDFFPSYFKWTYGNPSAGPSAQLPRPAFLLPREQVQRVDFFRIFLEVLPRSHGELPRKLYLGVEWKCVICILGWVNMGEPFFMILSSMQMGSGSFSASA